MPILTQDPPRRTLQRLQNLLSQPPSCTGSSPPALTKIDHQSWRGRKRSRSPSTSPVVSTERTWRPWSGVAAAVERQELLGGSNDVSGYQRHRAPDGFGGSFGGFGADNLLSANSYASGVGLVAPKDWNSSEETSIAAEISSISVDGFNDDATSAITPHLHRSTDISTRTPSDSSSVGARDVKVPSTSRLLSGPLEAYKISDVVPVWDVNASRDNHRIASSGSRMSPSRAVKTETAVETMSSMGTCVLDCGAGDMENSHYVLTNALLNDLVSTSLSVEPL